jgi:predicted TIM-barrel fold metal-dependent hydrolase
MPGVPLAHRAHRRTAPPASGDSPVLDIFCHFMPKSVFERLDKLVPGHVALKAFPTRPSLLDVNARLAMMAEFPGLQQVLSLANPPIEVLGPPELTPELARIANDGLAELCAKHPQQFPAFIASMPMNNVDACMAEIDRAVTKLGARGIQMFTNVLGKPLSLPEFRPLFRRMAELDLPVWIHPIRGPNHADYSTEKMSENEVWFSFGWPFETTACVTRLIYSRLLDELPTLKIITHHYCGMVPFFAGKIELGFDQIFFGTSQTNPQAEKAGLKKRPIEYYRMIYADTALNGAAAATKCGHAFFGTDHSVFATDAPFDAEDGRLLIRTTISAIEGLDIPAAEKEKIFSGNAKRLLKLN